MANELINIAFMETLRWTLVHILLEMQMISYPTISLMFPYYRNH